MWNRVALAAFVAAGLFIFPNSTAAQEYYKDKTVRVILGFAAGGGVDGEGRVLAKFLERLLPGNPSVIAQNMPGAGGMVATNWFEQFAKPDGLTLHYTSTTSIQQQILGAEGAKFDLRNWQFIGTVVRQPSVAMIRPDKLPRLSTAGPPLKVGVRAGDESWNAIFLWGAEFLKWNLAWVPGYPGGGEIRLAFRRGETDIFGTAGIANLKELAGEGFQPFVQLGRLGSAGSFQKRPEFPDVPTFEQMLGAKRPSGVPWQAYVSWAGADSAGRPLYAAPKTPPEIMKLLRDAMARMKDDKAVHADLAKVAGEETEILLANEGEPVFRQLLAVSLAVRDYSNGLTKKYLGR